VQFIGGEPFLKKRLLFELILQAKDIGYKFLEVFSNCTLVTEQDLKRLRRYDVQLAVSIYSQNEQIHNQITQKKYSWEKSIENLRKAKNLGISLRAAIVVMKQNEDTSKKTVEFLKTQLGIKNVKIDFVRPAGRGCDVDLVSETIFENQRFQKPKFPKTNVESFTKRKFGHNCFFDKTCISSTGEVYPCVMEHEVSYGNVKSHSLAEIFSTDLTRNFRGLSKDHIDVCRDCEYRYCCFDCRVRARGLSKNDNYYAKPWWCCYDPYKGKWISNAKGGDINGKKQ